MSENYGKRHEEDVLRAFDKMKADFEAQSPQDTAESNASAQGRSRSKAAKGAAAKEAASTSTRTKSAHKRASGKNGGEKKKKKFKIHWGRILLVLLAICAVGAAGVAAYVWNIVKDVPEINPDNLYELLSENSIIYDSDGNSIENVYAGDALRTNLEYNEIPENLVNAFVSIEDKTFWDHHGFNFIRIMGAIRDKVVNGGKVSGTSTITQQLARNLYLADIKGQRSMARKITEAYYSVIIEQKLSKEQIIEAYMNTIYLGFNSNGVQAAAQSYFGKDAKDLSLVECACLASLPQSPNSYAPIKRIATDEIEDPDALDIVSRTDEWTIYFNDTVESRMKLVLRFMHEQGKISDEVYNSTDVATLRDCINPGTTLLDASYTSYFADFVVKQVKEDLQTQLGYDADQADKLIYNGGLRIYSTMDNRVQSILEEVYSDPSIFPSVGSYKKDGEGNILKDNGDILLYSEKNLFDNEGNFWFRNDEYSWNSDGSLKILKGKRLNIYNTTVGGETDYSIEFKGMYQLIDNKLYSRSGGTFNIPAKYKTRDNDGNVIISADYFQDKPETFQRGDGTLILSNGKYTLKQLIMQPQSAMVITELETGRIIGMIGGRGVEGKLLYNRALSPRQPGSSIKPLSVYSGALQAGKDGLGNFSVAMPLDDRPIAQGGRAWPKNWYSGYTGMTNFRHAVEQSINCCAVQLYLQLDPEMIIHNLQNMGITSIVSTGPVNDQNASALALGGMAKGISPLEMTAAYGTLGNYGTYIAPTSYTKITTKNGDLVLENTPITHKVYDEDVASLMVDVLRTTVTNGLGSPAKLKSQPSAGKTGTTSDRYDLWFCGITPQFAASTWVGNDVNISMNQGSSAAAKVWAKVMDQVGAMYEKGEFEMRGEFVTATVDKYSGMAVGPLTQSDPRGGVISDIFIKETVPSEPDDCHVSVTVCGDTGYLATPTCPRQVNKVAIVRPGGESWEKIVATSIKNSNIKAMPDAAYDAPEYYCPVHNPTTTVYPVSPLYNGTSIYTGNSGTLEPETPPEPEQTTDNPPEAVGDPTQPQPVTPPAPQQPTLPETPEQPPVDNTTPPEGIVIN
ncbi:MAG: transglycosylase domain-containing protein [Clostridia bacterium]|nr:transglycosylase domain-containing protein [Clostridia bacterium]